MKKGSTQQQWTQQISTINLISVTKSTTIEALSCINTLIYCTFLYENALIYCIQGCVTRKCLYDILVLFCFVHTQYITIQTHNLREKIFHYKVFLVHNHWSYLLTDGPRWLLRNSHSAGLGKTGVLCKCYVIITMDRGSTSMIIMWLCTRSPHMIYLCDEDVLV